MDSLEETVVQFAHAAALSPEKAREILNRAVNEFGLTEPGPIASALAHV